MKNKKQCFSALLCTRYFACSIIRARRNKFVQPCNHINHINRLLHLYI